MKDFRLRGKCLKLKGQRRGGALRKSEMFSRPNDSNINNLMEALGGLRLNGQKNKFITM